MRIEIFSNWLLVKEQKKKLTVRYGLWEISENNSAHVK